MCAVRGAATWPPAAEVRLLPLLLQWLAQSVGTMPADAPALQKRAGAGDVRASFLMGAYHGTGSVWHSGIPKDGVCAPRSLRAHVSVSAPARTTTHAHSSTPTHYLAAGV